MKFLFALLATYHIYRIFPCRSFSHQLYLLTCHIYLHFYLVTFINHFLTRKNHYDRISALCCNNAAVSNAHVRLLGFGIDYKLKSSLRLKYLILQRHDWNENLFQRDR